jgi:hypothetical protein
MSWNTTKLVMEVIPQALSSEEDFYAGIADAESTALALVIEALINLKINSDPSHFLRQ